MSVRDKYGRTVCACKQCRAACKHMPGMLVPGDPERIAEYLGLVGLPHDELFAWHVEHFRASEGARVMDTQSGHVFNIPTIVPSQKDDGSCVFLDEGERCTIHEVAPFGCSHCDWHMDEMEANRRVSDALREIATDFIAASHRSPEDDTGGLYAWLHACLHASGSIAQPLIERRKAVEDAAAKIAEMED